MVEVRDVGTRARLATFYPPRIERCPHCGKNTVKGELFDSNMSPGVYPKKNFKGSTGKAAVACTCPGASEDRRKALGRKPVKWGVNVPSHA